MRKIISIMTTILAASAAVHAQGPSDTLKVSNLFTSHIVFSTDVIYADLSNPQILAAKVVEQSKNMMAVKARAPFAQPVSVSALESNGRIHTFIVLFEEHPEVLVVDCRQEKTTQGSEAKGNTDGKVTVFRNADAPLASEVRDAPQALHHLSVLRNSIRVSCINIITYSDITYMVLELENHSGVSYECADANFVIEGKKKSRKAAVYEKNISPRSRSGSLSAGPSGKSRICYTMDKLSLAEDQVLNIYLYEEGGPRELLLTIGADDINKARNRIN